MKLLQSNKQLLSFGSVLSFLIPLFFYLKGLAPSVTLEDSGEFITAAYHFGIPHPPGYPLYTLLAGIFLKLVFWLDSAAFKMNLFSALTFAASGIFIFHSYTHLLKSTINKDLRLTDTLYGIAATMFALLTPHVFRQAIITEVYGLHNLIWSACIFIITRILCQNIKTNSAHHITLFFLFALGLTIHPLMISLLFLGLGLSPYLFKDILNVKKNILNFSLAFAMGLLPLIYLPIRALVNPVINWGEPSNLNNFFAHIFRKQYSPVFFRDKNLFIEQIRQQVIYLFEQYYLELIIIGLLGLSLLYITKNKKWFYFFLLSLICTGPLTVILTNFNLDLNSQIDYEETSSLNSVFYLVHYQTWGLLIAFAAMQITSYFNSRILIRISTTALLVFSLHLGYKSLHQEDKSNDRFAEQNLHNLEVLFSNIQKSSLSNNQDSSVSNLSATPVATPLATPIGVVITNWDPFTFPMIYFQNVEMRAKNIIVIDVEMLKAPWYIHQLQRWYPDFCKQFDFQFNNYLTEYALFKQTHKAAPMSSYIAMIEKIIQQSVYANIPTLLMIDRQYFKLPPIDLSEYNIEPAIVGSLIRKKSDISLLNISITQFSFEVFKQQPEIIFDRLHKMLARYYSALLIEKAELEMVRNPKEYQSLLEIGLKLVKDQPRLANEIKKRHSL